MSNAKKFKFYNTIFILASIIVAIVFLKTPQVALFIEESAKFGPLAPVVSGFFYSDAVTAPAATAAIFYLGKVQNPFFIAAIGAFGAMLGDYIIFRYLKKRGLPEIDYVAKKFKIKSINKINSNKHLRALALLVAALIIASPLPDELGSAIFGALKFQTRYFLVLSYCLNFLGILAISWLGLVL